MGEEQSHLIQEKINDKSQNLCLEILDSLDETSINELYEGYDHDVDSIVNALYEETTSVLSSFSSKVADKTKFNDITNLGDTVEETLRIEVFNYFITSVLDDFVMNWHHIEWGQLTQIYQKLCFIAARDHSKSFEFVYAYPLWRMYRYRKFNSDGSKPRHDLRFREGMFVTNEASLARKHMRGIKEEIENNSKLSWKLLPDDTSSEWGNELIKAANGAELTYKTAKSQMRGPHPAWIVVDDYLDESCLSSEIQRNSFTDKFYSEIENMLPSYGQLIKVGTPFHEDDLFGRMKKDPNYKVFEYPALFPDGKLLDETRHSVEEILSKRDSQGSIIFSREILVKPVTDASSILPYKEIVKCFDDSFVIVNNRHSLPVEFQRIVMGVDLARSGNVGADYTVFTTLGVDNKGKYWILNIWRDSGKSMYEQISILKYLYRNFRHDLIVIENNQMQQFFVDESLRQNLPVKGHTMLGQGASTKNSTNKFDLNKGFPSLVILFEQESIKIPRGDERSVDITDALTTELASMTWTSKGKIEGSGSHDDMPMSLLHAVIGARQGTGYDMAMV